MSKNYIGLLLMIFSLNAVAAKSLIYCMEGSPAGFNPQTATDSVSLNASSQAIFNRLVDFKKGTTVVEPSLALSWTVGKDRKSYTFKLRKDVAFQSNEFFTPTRNFNADDVVYTFKSQMDEKHPLAIPNGNYEYFKGMELDKIIADVKKIDDYTVEFTLTKPEAPFLANLAMDFASILSEEYAKALVKSGKGLKTLETNPVGTGPFVFKSYQKDSAVRYTAFDKYFKGKPKVDQLVFVVVTDSTVRLQKMKTGECHVMSEPQPQDIEQIQKISSLKLMSLEGLNTGYVAFNTTKKPFDNAKVREAITLALNKKSYIDAIYKGQGAIAKNPYPPTIWSYSKATKDDEYNVEKAKKLLAEAGYKDGFETELWTVPVSRPYIPNGKKMGELMQADLAKIGVKVKLVTYDWPSYLQKTKQGLHPFAQMGWTGDNGDPDNFLNVLLGCSAVEAGSNIARWCNKEFNDLVQKAKEEPTQAKRTVLYEKAQAIFKKEKPWVTIAHAKLNKVVSDKVTGYTINPFGHEQFESVDIK